MEEVIYNTNLVVLGNLITGDDGILDATENVTWQHQDGQTKEQYLAMLCEKLDNLDVKQGDLDISGKKVTVNGGLFVYGNIVYDYKTWKGHITAQTPGRF